MRMGAELSVNGLETAHEKPLQGACMDRARCRRRMSDLSPHRLGCVSPTSSQGGNDVWSAVRTGRLSPRGRCPLIRALEAVQPLRIMKKRLEKPLVALNLGDPRSENDGPPFDENQHLKRIFAERSAQKTRASVRYPSVLPGTTAPTVISTPAQRMWPRRNEQPSGVWILRTFQS